MGLLLELLGVDCDLKLQKREAYRADLVAVRADATALAGSNFHVEYNSFNSLTHKLLSACRALRLVHGTHLGDLARPAVVEQALPLL